MCKFANMYIDIDITMYTTIQMHRCIVSDAGILEKYIRNEIDFQEIIVRYSYFQENPERLPQHQNINETP